jgi:hypothetical protein
MTETINRGDIIWFSHTNRLTRETVVEWATVSGRSTINPAVIYARDSKGRARCIHENDVTRIQPKENTSA